VALAALWIGLAGPAFGEEVVFNASVNRTRVPLDGQVKLTVSVSVPSRTQIGHLELPDTGSLRVVSTAREQSRSFSFSGGSSQHRQFTNTVLTLQPTAQGAVTIGAAELTYGGRTYKTKPIRVQVLAARGQRPSGPTSPLPGWPRGAPDDDWFRDPLEDMMRRPDPIGEGDIFIRAVASPEVVVEGQQVTVTLIVYSRVGARIAGIRWPKLDPFYSVDRDVKDAGTEEKLINGERFQYKVLARKALFPMGPGDVTIGAIEVEVEASASPFFPSDARTLRSKPIPIKVEPLPDGAPEGFHRANVGRFNLTARVDSDKVNLNQPVTYSLTVRGTGNIQNLRPPELPTLDRFKVFDPTVDVQQSTRGSEVRGSKTFEYILLPLASGKLTIPALPFAYYDPESGQYKAVKTREAVIEVTAAGGDGSNGDAPAGREVNIVAGAFKPIRYESDLKGYGPPFYRHFVFVLLLILAPAVWLLLVVGTWVRAQIHKDSPRSRMRRAAVEARRHWRLAGKAASAGRAGDFYSEIRDALLQSVESITGEAAQGLQLAELQRRLAQQGLAGELIEQIGRELENCDFGRFAPARALGGEISSAHERVGRLLKALPRGRLASGSTGGQR
jgi:hypothetical protein